MSMITSEDTYYPNVIKANRRSPTMSTFCKVKHEMSLRAPEVGDHIDTREALGCDSFTPGCMNTY